MPRSELLGRVWKEKEMFSGLVSQRLSLLMADKRGGTFTPGAKASSGIPGKNENVTGSVLCCCLHLLPPEPSQGLHRASGHPLSLAEERGECLLLMGPVFTEEGR